MNIVCPRCHSTAGGALHAVRPGAMGKWTYYMRHFEVLDREKGRQKGLSRWCHIGSDLSILRLSDPRYEEYLHLIYQCVDDYFADPGIDGEANKEMMLEAVNMLKESGWNCILSIEDKVKSDIMSRQHHDT